MVAILCWMSVGLSWTPPTELIKVHNMRPSILVERMTKLPLIVGDIYLPSCRPPSPPNCWFSSIVADDARGTIEVVGSREAIASYRALAALLDVKPTPLGIEVRIVDPVGKLDRTTRTNTDSYSTWGMEDGDSGVRIRLTPVVNEDATVTITANVSCRGQHSEFVVRENLPGTVAVSFGRQILIAFPKVKEAQADWQWLASDSLRLRGTIQAKVDPPPALSTIVTFRIDRGR
jgi:hypothetical protein